MSDRSFSHYTDGLRLSKKVTAAGLALVPEEYRIAYRPVDEDDEDCEGYAFILCVSAADYVTEAQAEIARLAGALETIKVEGPARLAAVKQQMRDDAITTTLQSSLAKAGVQEGLLEGAIAMVKKKSQFEVEKSDKGYAVLARTAFGLTTVECVVREFVDSDEGAAYRGKRAAAPAGRHFSQLQSGLKEPR